MNIEYIYLSLKLLEKSDKNNTYNFIAYKQLEPNLEIYVEPTIIHFMHQAPGFSPYLIDVGNISSIPQNFSYFKKIGTYQKIKYEDLYKRFFNEEHNINKSNLNIFSYHPIIFRFKLDKLNWLKFIKSIGKRAQDKINIELFTKLNDFTHNYPISGLIFRTLSWKI